MASLEELLAEEGFKSGGITKPKSNRTSISMPLYLCQEGRSSLASAPDYHKPRFERTKSELPKLVSRNHDQKAISCKRFENHFQENENPNDGISWKDMGEDQGCSNGSNSGSGRGFNQDHRRDSGLKLEQWVSKVNFEEPKRSNEPAIDQVAIQAVISILSSYIARFIKDKHFRRSLRRNSLICLGLSKSEEEDGKAKNGAVSNLREAIESIERLVEESENPKQLNRAAVQLSVVAGLNSKDLKGYFTCGIPNSSLAACAHIYLSVIHKLRRKDRVSAKHLLQAFCDSPFQARTILLRQLWDYLFLPHLSHLRVWYDQEAQSIEHTRSRSRKMKLLERVYNQELDSGTYQFAVYYKEWLKEGIGAPTIPSIGVPSSSVYGGPSLELVTSPVNSNYSQRRISKSLYQAVFGCDGANESNRGELEGTLIVVPNGSFDGIVEGAGSTVEEDEGAGSNSPEPRTDTGQPDPGQIDSMDGKLVMLEEARRSPIQDIKEFEEDDSAPCLHTISESTTVLHTLQPSKVNELTLQKLAKTVFQTQQSESTESPSAFSPSCSHCDKLSDLDAESGIRSCPRCEIKKTKLEYATSGIDSSVASSSAELHGNYEYFEENSPFSSIPKDFICPLTGMLFEDPVTLETGQTFERVAIKKWFNQGNETCPITRQTLRCLAVPNTNFVLKRVIDVWKSEHCRNLLLFSSQIARNWIVHNHKSKDEAAVLILEQLLTGFNTQENMENARHLISLGGLQFLIQRLELGNMEEKSSIAALLCCCIKADGGCRNYLVRNIKKTSILELLYSKEISCRMKAVLLLIELICLNRRTTVSSFLGGLWKEGIMNTMHVLLVYLQSSLPEQRPLVAVLLLQFDLLVEPRRYSIYREEAIDAISTALDSSLMDEKVQEQCCRALLVLGGRFSFSGDVLTEAWLLKQAGFDNGYNCISISDEDESAQIDETVQLEEEEKAREEWWKNLTVLFLSNGKKPFLESITKCLRCGNPDLVRACLVTVAWLSHTLASLSDNTQFQLTAFAAFVPSLKGRLENDERIENRVLAVLSLLNFSKISECQLLLSTLAEELAIPLRNLMKVTSTAKQLRNTISRDSVGPLARKN